MKQIANTSLQPAHEIYAFRRRGLDDFCTCSRERFEELSFKPHLFETTIFYTAQQQQTQLLTDDEMESIKANLRNGDYDVASRAVERIVHERLSNVSVLRRFQIGALILEEMK